MRFVLVCPETANIANCNNCWNPELECVECLEGWWWKDYNTCLSKYLMVLYIYHYIYTIIYNVVM